MYMPCTDSPINPWRIVKTVTRFSYYEGFIAALCCLLWAMVLKGSLNGNTTCLILIAMIRIICRGFIDLPYTEFPNKS